MLRSTFFILIFSFINVINGLSQALDEEVGFIYVKAEYLLETGRYDEAVTHYNQVITKDPQYKNALVHRGMAKYALAAYKGAKIDALQHIELLGISDKSAALLGRVFYQMEQYQAAINSLTAAIQLNPNNADFYFWRAQIYEAQGMRLGACNDYETAVNKGNTMALAKSRNFCGNNNTPKQPVNVPSTKNPNPIEATNTEPQNDNANQEEEVLSEGTRESEENTDENVGSGSENEEVVDDTLPPNDDTENNIEIDEELAIMIYGQALGLRKIDEVPSILILADEKGKVALDICVNKEGKVVKAEFNGRLSSIAKKSLVSLAIRKAQEFEFSANQYEMQCGIMIFEIK